MHGAVFTRIFVLTPGSNVVITRKLLLWGGVEMIGLDCTDSGGQRKIPLGPALLALSILVCMASKRRLSPGRWVSPKFPPRNFE